MTTYLHFSTRPEPPEVPPRALNAFAGGTGPLGVYAYPSTARVMTFAADRPYVFKLTPQVQTITSTRAYSAADLEHDLKILGRWVDISRPLRLWDKFRSTIRNADKPFTKLWYVLARLPNEHADADDPLPGGGDSSSFANPALGTKLLVALNHLVIDDRLGIMYSSEPEQAVFLTNESFTAERVMKNPAEDDSDLDANIAGYDAGVARARAVFEKSPAVIVREGKRRELHILSGDSTQPAGAAYRISWFGEDGPLGHEERPTIEKLMEHYAFTPVGALEPATDDQVIAWTSTPEFIDGSIRVAFTQASNALGYYASKLPNASDREAAYAARRRGDEISVTDIEAATAYLNRVIHAMPKNNPSTPRYRSYRQNPTPWVTNLLARTYTQLESKVPPKWLPKIDKVKPKGKSFTAQLPEYGCGAFGCVLPTLDASVVLKVTSDETEATFARELAKKLPTPICVEYHLVSKIEGAERKGRDVFLLWREESADVGKIDEIVGQHAEDLIAAQHDAAMACFELFSDGDKAGGRAKMEAWRKACRAMGKLPELAFVAAGLVRAADEAGILISDVHGGNLGVCSRNGNPAWVITDPGNVVVL